MTTPSALHRALPITLYVDAFFTSPIDFRCWVALKEKALEFTTSRVMMAEGQTLSTLYTGSGASPRACRRSSTATSGAMWQSSQEGWLTSSAFGIAESALIRDPA